MKMKFIKKAEEVDVDVKRLKSRTLNFDPKLKLPS